MLRRLGIAVVFSRLLNTVLPPENPQKAKWSWTLVLMAGASVFIEIEPAVSIQEPTLFEAGTLFLKVHSFPLHLIPCYRG